MLRFRSNWTEIFTFLGSLALIVAALYWAQKILIPLALACLLSFILHPVVVHLQRLKLNRLMAVLITLLLTLAIFGGLARFLAAEAKSVADQWEVYQENVTRKLDDLNVNDVLLERIQIVLQGVVEGVIKSAIAPLLDTIVQGFFVLVLLVFMLSRWEDLRDRLIWLIGRGRRTIPATRAFDEASHKISKYLLAQLLINSVFGSVLALALTIIGVPYAALWGFLAALLRFVPYLGTWIAAALPIMFSFANAPPQQAWVQPAEVLGVFLLLEIFTAYVLEPLLFGMSVGVSPPALLVAAIFWSWLWGPVGLLLSTPLTVCLFVIGRYVPRMEFLEIVLGDEPALEPKVNLYQRLLARDFDQAAEIMEQPLRERSPEEVLETILVPALVLAKTDREKGNLSKREEQFILQAVGDMVADIGSAAPETSEESSSNGFILGIPAADRFDELALQGLQQALQSEGISMDVGSPKMLSSEVLERIEKTSPGLIVMGSLAPGGLAQTRYVCKRLRRRFPDLPILVGRWGLQGSNSDKHEAILKAGANVVTTSLPETKKQALVLLQSASHRKWARDKVAAQ